MQDLLEPLDCPICYKPIIDGVNVSITICKHTFHTDCLIASGNACRNTCPMCRANISSFMTDATTDTTLTIPHAMTQCQCIEQTLQIREELKKQIEEEDRKRKNFLKKTDKKRYQLFYGNK